MKLTVLKERRPDERRVAVSPDSIARLKKLGFEVTVERGAGEASAITDDELKQAGAVIAADAASAIKGADIVFKVQAPMSAEEGEDEIRHFTKGQILLCHMNATSRLPQTKALAEKGVALFAMEFVPRISRAQSMDVLSSQSNVAGYKAVLDGLEHFGKVVPLMSTAAGRIPPANVFVMGAGVAGLQAIATAKRLGAVVSATDVRPATKEQCESLGAKFIAVEDEEFKQAQTEGGYAKEMSAEYRRKQAELVAATIAKQDIVVTTALIPGRPAPVLITEDMVKTMKPGSVIVDLAVEAGGNCPLSEAGKVVTKHGVILVGHGNWPSRVAATSSALFARNLYNFVELLIDKESGKLNAKVDDAVVKGTMAAIDGKLVHPALTDTSKRTASPASGKAASKKTAAKKATSKKAATKKTGARKTAAKKSSAKKTAAKKPAAGKPSTDKPAPSRSKAE